MPRAPHPLEVGDFQTPADLAGRVCRWLRSRVLAPRSVVEPTCGVGRFLFAAREAFPTVETFFGVERNASYVAEAALVLATRPGEIPGLDQREGSRIEHADVFDVSWPSVAADLPEPILVLGNPPWVTNAAIGAVSGSNLPDKVNLRRLRGIEARTGASNFDISEAILIRLAEAFGVPGPAGCRRPQGGPRAYLAMLVKTAVARSFLAYAWTQKLPIARAAMVEIDAKRAFGAQVSACLLYVELGTYREDSEPTCDVYSDLDSPEPTCHLGFANGQIVPDLPEFRRTECFVGDEPTMWRSGIKHDCTAVFVLQTTEHGLVNGLGERADVESEVLFPLLRGGDVARGRRSSRYLLVTQKRVGESPERLRETAPRAWAYLEAHEDRLAQRKSSIYRGRPAFSIFGVGPYSFSAWKVAISGLHKDLAFRVVGPVNGKPVVFDDTVYLLPCADEAEAEKARSLLSSEEGRAFFAARIFPTAKRPVTAKVLRQLSLSKLAKAK